MSRHDKIGAAVLGLLLFSGLFYFIYTTMKNPLPAEFGDEEFFSEGLEDDLDEELAGEEEAAELEAPAPAAEDGEAAAPAPAKK